jgi:hypothetical protein
MLRSNMAIDLIAEFTGLTLKQIQKLQKLSVKQSQMPKAKKQAICLQYAGVIRDDKFLADEIFSTDC